MNKYLNKDKAIIITLLNTDESDNRNGCVLQYLETKEEQTHSTTAAERKNCKR